MPLYTATRLIVPTGSELTANVATPPLNATGVVFSCVVPLKKFTVPAGVPLVVEATVAVSVNEVPEIGDPMLLVSVVVVGAKPIVTEPDPAPSATV